MSDTDNVVELGVVTRLPTPVPRILAKAAGADLETVVVAGYKKSGEFYFASSDSDAAQVAWLLDWAKRRLQETADSLEQGE